VGLSLFHWRYTKRVHQCAWSMGSGRGSRGEEISWEIPEGLRRQILIITPGFQEPTGQWKRIYRG
jgi:hypothetical protein